MAYKTDFLITEDDVRIAFDHYINGFDKVIIIAHGFNLNKDVFAIKKIAEFLSKEYDVITFDFRGHGKSADFFTWTALEERDLSAVTEYAKSEGYKKIALLGLSLGAAVAIIHSSHNKDVDNVISVSAPSDIWKINFRVWEPQVKKEIELNMSYKVNGKGMRPGNPLIAKIKPINVVQKISPRPILFIQGSDDWLIKKEHGEKLFEKAKEPKQIETIKGAGHAENIFIKFPEEFENICKNWLKKTFQ